MRNLIAFAALMLAAPAGAHEWYDAVCCNDQDCAPIPASDIEITAEGHVYRPTGQLIPYGEQHPMTSPDGEYHACVYPDGRIRTRAIDGRRVYCLHIPLGGS